jgi:uncharacterized protein HemY
MEAMREIRYEKGLDGRFYEVREEKNFIPVNRRNDWTLATCLTVSVVALAVWFAILWSL